MVLDELNQEFPRRQILGKALYSFLDPQDINGLAMFGFLSPHIIEVMTLRNYVGEDLAIEVICRFSAPGLL